MIRKKLTYYRTKIDPTDYRFLFEEQEDGSWKAFIVSQPSYGSRDEDFHVTHRLSDGGRNYVCWDRNIPSLEAARAVAATWAEATQRYINTGTRF